MSALADPLGPRNAAGAGGLLGEFNRAGVLSAADVHVATRLAALAGEGSQAVMLAIALAVRGPRLGHVLVDLATIRDTATVESDEPVDLTALSWPEPGDWLASLAASPLVALGEAEEPEPAPVRLIGTRCYLDRYWREERAVADDLNELTASGRLEVIAGGPGTGKTTRVARTVARLVEQGLAPGAPRGRMPLIALAAPTGKAAARLQEAVHQEAAAGAGGERGREALMGLRGSTLHRLLGWRPGSHSRFAHHRGNRLAHDVVIVDETSMVSLWLMARLVEAVRRDARLIVVGDPGQLTSIEAGVVLGDIVSAGDVVSAGGSAIARSIVTLERVHRYGGGIARVADAVRRGDPDAVVAALRAAPAEVTWLDFDVAQDGGEGGLEVVRERAVAAGRAVAAAARDRDPGAALRALGNFRLLCAHRHGPHGVSDWTSRVRGWLAAHIEDIEARDYVGRPLLVTQNDYELGLYNGDSGVIVEGPTGAPVAVFERGSELLQFSPLRLGAVDTVYAMTVHKSQGSQYDTAAVLLPSASSRILTRELLYTAVTRAREELILVGSEDAVRRAVERPVARASGLGDRLR